MLQLSPQTRIVLATEPVDFRTGTDGLAAVCRQVLMAPPLQWYGPRLLQSRRHRTQNSGAIRTSGGADSVCCCVAYLGHAVWMRTSRAISIIFRQ